jgi:DNA ligase (NAD+)
MDIEGLGEETIDLLFGKKLIKNIADLYELKQEQLVPLERLGEKSAANILNSIAHSKNIPYSRVLYALGIRHVGETVAKTLSKEFRSIDDLMSADEEKLTSIREIGPKIAGSIIIYFADQENQEIIERLRRFGIRFSESKTSDLKTGRLDRKIIVISGVFRLHSRDEYKDLIEKNGGKNSSSISANTSFILAGENMGPSKRVKAEELGIPLLNEEDFLKIIEEES